MGRRKCKICGAWIEDNSQSVPYKNGYAHTKCFNTYSSVLLSEKEKELKRKAAGKRKVVSTGVKKKTTVSQAEAKGPMSEEEYKHKRRFYDYVHKCLGDEKIEAKHYSLIDKYVNRYGLTWDGMYDTLQYLHEIQTNILLPDESGIERIPYYYRDAEKYFKSIHDVEKNNADIDLKGMYKRRTVVIDPHRTRKIKQLDITQIGKSGV
ncbi:hypothetical protein SAMN05216391_10847 [Lachnospiraceae bacterium KHCPX20]|nr:hypothetical protein SAMN05216391_10847 [Lachnospiraceae bacterium KHCPX20]